MTITAIFFFASILLHELSHALMARRLGLPVQSITLFIFGGVSNLGREPDKPRDEFLIAIVGPGMSFVLAGLFAVIWLATLNISDGISLISAYLAFVNLSLGVFNMLPGFPLDGGRVFRSVVWARQHNRLRATRIAAMAGVGVAYIMMLGGITMALWVSVLSGVWLIFIGWFLRNVSEASYQQMALREGLLGVPAGQIADNSSTAVSPEMTLRDLTDIHILPSGSRYFPVLSEAGSLLGLVTLSDLKRTPAGEWGRITVYRAMTPLERLHTLSPGDDALHAFEVMVQQDVHQLPVLDDGRLIGFVTRARLLDLIHARMQMP